MRSVQRHDHGVAPRHSLCQTIEVQGDLRAALQYVPSFQEKVFVLVMNAARMPEQALAEALLDLTGLQQIGVKLVLISIGSGEAEITNRLVDGELKWEQVDDDSNGRFIEILERGQLALIEWPGVDPLCDEVVNLSSTLQAAKLIVFLPEGGFGDEEGIHAMAREKAAAWRGPAAELFSRAAYACAQGVPRVHLLNECQQGVLLDELFSNEGVGVMIHADDYLEIRNLSVSDIPELLAMIGRSMRDAHLIPRTYEEVEKAREDFLVLTVDGNVVGCVALHCYEEGCAEIACLYVKQTHESGGYGRRLVEAAEEKARALHVTHVIALTTRAVDYFTKRLGYEPASVEALPAARKIRLQESGRASFVVKKDL